MKVTIKDAFNILGISAGTVTSEDIKQAYRRAAQKYHPDRNPAGLEMMQAINAAYEAIKDFSGIVEAEGNNKDYGDQLNTALNIISGLGLTIEICGAWIWVSGNTYPYRKILDNANFIWAPKKKCWYFRPTEYKSRNRNSWSMDKIRSTYGSEIIINKQKQLHPE